MVSSRFFSKAVKASALAAFALIGLSAASAKAGTYSQCGTSCSTSFTVNYSHDTGNGLLSATSTWQIKQFTSSVLEMWITMSNTTTANLGITKASVMSYGVGTDPDTTASFISSGVIYDGLEIGANFPGGFTNLDICVFGANNCSGGNINDGQAIGAASDLVKLLITPKGGGSFGSSIVLNPFPIKFQTNITSYEFAGCEGACTPKVAEPASLGLYGIGLLALAEIRRRRQALTTIR